MQNRIKLKKEYEEAYEEHSEAIFRQAYFRLGDRDRAIDITQETFIKTWDYLQKGNEVKNIKAFLYKVLRNLVINEYQRRKPTLSLDTMREESGFDPEAPIEEKENRKIETSLLLILDKLEDIYKQAIILKYIEGFKVGEIAEILEETESNISVRLHRGISKLQELYKTNEKDN